MVQDYSVGMLDCVASQAPSLGLRVIYFSLALVCPNYPGQGAKDINEPMLLDHCVDFGSKVFLNGH
jgi:hypothetical protein